jgi:hypothetical protein
MEAIMCCEFYHGLEDICILSRAVASDKIYYYPSKKSQIFRPTIIQLLSNFLYLDSHIVQSE